MNRTLGRKIKTALKILPDNLYLKLIYLLIYKRRLNLRNPQYWTEKMQYKKLYHRSERYTTVADKIKLRDYAYEKLNTDLTPEILWIGKDPQEIPFDKLPNAFVIKTNHGIGTNLIVTNKHELNQQEAIEAVNRWLDYDYFYPERQWAYKKIDRKVLVEKLLYDAEGRIPADMKLYMFNGKLGAINIHIDRFTENHQNIMVDKDFNLLHSEVPISTDLQHLKPKRFDQMVVCAEKLSSEFDFIRVDFYDLGDQFALSELTHYPAAGIKRMPKELDLQLGEIWELSVD
ncbi:ATP-grasp fold amidoligase family protein [Globicatella sulfidifaciens]|uniref:Glycosyl transferase n=1 Tax=Globicatella sulfidifaciens TaxID=136093 RepID=A0A7X8C5E9_9LACT|nr:ATP-grasp fold amidoligase family protein [Globicatella sulfidifaciens]NLJ19270.1 hypothetical protein [Globicatella sulfidifaciens]